MTDKATSVSLSRRFWTEADRIGFYGCSDRLVAVGRQAKPGKPPINITVDCPACGRSHVVHPMWRHRRKGDVVPEIALP